MKPQLKDIPQEKQPDKAKVYHIHHVKKDKKIREKLKEHQVDDMVNNSFPASDPPSTY